MRKLDSLTMKAAKISEVPAGNALRSTAIFSPKPSPKN
jgi:folate-dependent tRNA-U54 methylase TrmFO/GidA